MQKSDDLIWRSPRPDDAQQTLALQISCEEAEYGQADADMEDLRHDWGQIDLSQDAWLVFTASGTLVGYAAVIPWGHDWRLDFYTHPDWPDAGLSAELLARSIRRAEELAAQDESEDEVVAKTYLAHVNQQERPSVEQAGFQPGRYIFQMQIDLEGELVAPLWPDGVVVRTAVPAHDTHAIYELIQTAFDQPGRKPPTFEQWRGFMLRADIFDPVLWFLAHVKGEIVGACLSYAYSSGGWVRQLGVAPAWQRQGIGAALLCHAFATFKTRDFNNVGLTVESKRPNAYAFYQKLGMRKIRQYDEYWKVL